MLSERCALPSGQHVEALPRQELCLWMPPVRAPAKIEHAGLLQNMRIGKHPELAILDEPRIFPMLSGLRLCKAKICGPTIELRQLAQVLVQERRIRCLLIPWQRHSSATCCTDRLTCLPLDRRTPTYGTEECAKCARLHKP